MTVDYACDMLDLRTVQPSWVIVHNRSLRPLSDWVTLGEAARFVAHYQRVLNEPHSVLTSPYVKHTAELLWLARDSDMLTALVATAALIHDAIPLYAKRCSDRAICFLLSMKEDLQRLFHESSLPFWADDSDVALPHSIENAGLMRAVPSDEANLVAIALSELMVSCSQRVLLRVGNFKDRQMAFRRPVLALP